MFLDVTEGASYRCGVVALKKLIRVRIWVVPRKFAKLKLAIRVCVPQLHWWGCMSAKKPALGDGTRGTGRRHRIVPSLRASLFGQELESIVQ